jgi:nucleoside phosphorylase
LKKPAQVDLASVKGKVDVGILTIREDEFEAVLHHFPVDTRAIGRRQYNLSHRHYEDGSPRLVAIIRCIEQGTGEAQLAARDLIDELGPKWLLIVGIGGGRPSGEFTLGDVVVSTRVHDLTLEATLQNGQREYNLTGGPLDPQAAAVASNIPALQEIQTWNTQNALRAKRPPLPMIDDRFAGQKEWIKRIEGSLKAQHTRKAPKVVAGAIASSDRLIRDPELLQLWLTMLRHVYAVEMEAAGVYRVAHASRTPFLAIRGISDIVGLKRADAWTKYACGSAAAFASALLPTLSSATNAGNQVEVHGDSPGTAFEAKGLPPTSLSTLPRKLAPSSEAPLTELLAQHMPVRKIRFLVAFSFPENDRARVDAIANALATSMGQQMILYDKWHPPEFVWPVYDPHLTELYHKLYHRESLLLVFLFSKDYFLKHDTTKSVSIGNEKAETEEENNVKAWCGLRWRLDEDLQDRCEEERLMLLRVGQCTIPRSSELGNALLDILLDIDEMTASEVANQILQHLRRALPLTGKVDQMVTTLRDTTRRDITSRCGKIRILTMEQPIQLGGVYTEVNILKRRSANLRKTRAELVEEANQLQKSRREGDSSETFDRFGISDVRIDRILGADIFDKGKDNCIMVYGKPGAGKTTFVKRLAMECIDGHFRPELVPAFVTLKNFAEEHKGSLFDYIRKQWGANKDCHVLLRRGRALVLLDGLDEVRDRDFNRVRKAIESFTAEFHRCTVVLTCRIAAREYTFERFTEVEMADFSPEQIRTFAMRWFSVQGEDEKAADFLSKLRSNKQIAELASSPLLLTLLCLVFQERLDFEGTRAELYEEGIEILLRKWDAKRGIERDRPYGLSISDMQALLGEIAYRRFLNSDYFFDGRSLAQQIEDFVSARDFVRPKEEFLADRVLSSIESNIGLLVQRASNVYSFSHLTFQEYFTAWRVAKKPTLLAEIGPYVGDVRWREVWLLLLNMFDADDIVSEIKNRCDALVCRDVEIQKRMQGYASISDRVIKSDERRMKRGFYLCLGLALDRASNLPLAEALTLQVDGDFDLYYTLVKQSTGAKQVDLFKDLASVLSSEGDISLFRAVRRDFNELRDLGRDLSLATDYAAPSLASDLRTLSGQLEGVNELTFPSWRDELRRVAIHHRQIGYPALSRREHNLMRQYSRANILLLECMNSARTLTNEIRGQIEETMLLPSQGMRSEREARNS